MPGTETRNSRPGECHGPKPETFIYLILRLFRLKVFTQKIFSTKYFSSPCTADMEILNQPQESEIQDKKPTKINNYSFWAKKKDNEIQGLHKSYYT